MITSTPTATRDLLARAEAAYAADPEAAEIIGGLRGRLDEPLRVAIAGRLKAGKSTLLNALLGEQVAATDAGECTLVTTWYRYGATPSARLILRTGETVALVLRRHEGRLDIDLAGHPVEDVARVDVTWPSPVLSEMTLIDTPGLGSLTLEASQRTVDLVTAESGPGVDALIFLMQRLQAGDLDLLTEFHMHADPSGGEEHPLNVIGVLSRSDELGDGLTSLITSRQLAAEYAAEPRVQSLCQQVLPLAGLIAEGAQTLRQSEFETLRRLAALPRAEREVLMVSAARFVSSEHDAVSTVERLAVMERLGLVGIRLAMTLMPVDGPAALADGLLGHSGLPALKASVLDSYTDSADLLKARSALLALNQLLWRRECPDEQIVRDLERILASAHDLRELRLRTRLRAHGVTGWSRSQVQRALRVAGGEGTEPAQRLGSANHPLDIRRLARTELEYWRGLAQDPMAVRTVRDTAETLIRTCEEILTTASLDPSAVPAARPSA